MAAASPSAGSSPSILPAPSTIITGASIAGMAFNSTTPMAFLGPSRNYTIPPRPRPGRKPATDTPPTKRKAQNRAAQRAFRERRAARVGELEEQLKETEDERQKRETEMHDLIVEQEARISRLLDDVQRLDRERSTLQERCGELERNVEKEREEKTFVVMELSYLRNGAQSTGTEAVPLPPRRYHPKSETVPASDLHSNLLECATCTTASSCLCLEATISIATSGCGKCISNCHFECMEETFKSPALEEPLQAHPKRPHSISQEQVDLKRPRVSIERLAPTEIDFTAMFSTKQIPIQERTFQDHSTNSGSAGESCGFCAEGTYCVCADAVTASSNVLERDQENRLPPILNGVKEVTPPPSENDVIGVTSDTDGYKLPLLHPNHRIHHALQPTRLLPLAPEIAGSSVSSNLGSQSARSCQNGPGSCKQCQDDPRSGLFCRSLGAMRASNSSKDNDSAGGCCGGESATGGCCKDLENGAPFLSCADTYKTLSSHKNFDRAADDLSNWLPKLQTSSGRYPGRAPLDIEAASVMNVIKYFDVRFGRN